MNYYFNKIRKSFKYVIHVNGIRGKSTTTRLIDAGFRNLGYKVFSKTTGTVPTIINVDNKDIPIKRLGPANIKEQYRMMHKAYKEGAEVLILECMAVNPELQYIVENKILKADINVISNVRLDHLDVMGEDLESIAHSLSNTTPTNGILILGEDKYLDIFNKVASKNNTKCIVAKDYKVKGNLDTFIENINTCLTLAESINLDTKLFYEGMRDYKKDPGAYSVYKNKDTTFINGLSINDPESILKVYNENIKDKYDINKLCILVNNRLDRIFRTNQMIELVNKLQIKKIYVSGSNISYFKKKIKIDNVDIVEVNKIEDILNGEIIFGIGNIKGFGETILEYFKGGI